MPTFVLDTNVYIHAIRSGAIRRELADWQRSMAPRLFGHAVVAAEILLGARTMKIHRQWHEAWVAPAERVGRVVVPRYAHWLQASAVVTRLCEAGELAPGSVRPSFFNDCLMAVSCAAAGHTIVTHNIDDFARIARVHAGVRTVSPFP